MRKFLTALLAVFMLAAVAVLPLAAETTAVTKSEFDGTTVADAEALDLVVTEFMSNTTCSVTVGGTDVSSRNAFQYIELYNRSETKEINLYDLAIVRSKNSLSNDPWNAGHNFDAKMSLNPGNIYDSVPGMTSSYSKHACVNPGTAILKPGQFAVIWFWNDDTTFVSDKAGKSLGETTVVNLPEGGTKTIYHKAFRDHYKTENSGVTISDDLLIIAVYAGTTTDTTNNPRFALNTSSSYMYALVKDEAGGANFDNKTEPAFTANKGSDGTLYQYNEKIVCLWQWGVLTNLSIPSITPEGVSTIYVPANNVPTYYNASQTAIEGDEYEAKNNFYESGYVDGFKEVGLVAFEEKPTIGTMDAYQWVYVDPNRAPDSVKGLAANGKTWEEVAVENYLAANVQAGEEDVENPEEERLPGGVHVDRDNLGNKGQNADNTGNTVNNNDGGLTLWALILIIVAGVVVVGGGVVVVIIVLKKKNKPVAADDVATDDVQIVEDNDNNANE
ncbi:MAG: hypothetical protein E7624_05770 [Ruminococcaceae bacterium]|nr:hypothetical protein [Oscillospiraceae bacterium]